MSYLEPILVHPVRRQNFGDAVAQTCNPHLIPCRIDIFLTNLRIFFVVTDVFTLFDIFFGKSAT